MSIVAPRVSVALPVRNGRKYLRACLESLLAQTFRDFELIICDNASTDETEAICREYAQRDPRIRYHRNPANIGPAANFNRGYELARGEYLKWQAFDDILDPAYLENCVKLLDSDPTVSLAHTKTMIIDDQGQVIDKYRFEVKTDAGSAWRRFGRLIMVNHRRHRAVEIFGLMRGNAVRSMPLQGAYARGDSVFLARLSLRGRCVEIDQPLFLSRTHGEQSMQTLPSHMKIRRSWLSRMLGTGPLPPPEWWDASLKGKVVFPEWNLVREYWSSVRGARLGVGEAAACYGMLCLYTLKMFPKLGRDLAFAVERLLKKKSDAPAALPEAEQVRATLAKISVPDSRAA